MSTSDHQYRPLKKPSNSISGLHVVTKVSLHDFQKLAHTCFIDKLERASGIFQGTKRNCNILIWDGINERFYAFCITLSPKN